MMVDFHKPSATFLSTIFLIKQTQNAYLAYIFLIFNKLNIAIDFPRYFIWPILKYSKYWFYSYLFYSSFIKQ